MQNTQYLFWRPLLGNRRRRVPPDDAGAGHPDASYDAVKGARRGWFHPALDDAGAHPRQRPHRRAVQAIVKKEYFPDQFTVIPHDGDKVTVGDTQLTWHAEDTKLYNLNLYHFATHCDKPTTNVLFWAVTLVNCPREMHDVRLAIGSNAASVWWVNGQEVIGIYGDRQTVIDDGVSKRLTLKKGPNIIRAAIVNGGGATDFCARFLDENDNPLKGYTVTLSANGSAK